MPRNPVGRMPKATSIPKPNRDTLRQAVAGGLTSVKKQIKSILAPKPNYSVWHLMKESNSAPTDKHKEDIVE